MPAHITDLPVELLLDHLLPTLAIPDLLALTRTNRFIASVCNDDILWKLRLKRDFNFTANADTARESGFKVLYRGLRKPSVYTWGATGQSRLGLSHMPRGFDKHSGGVPFPAQVTIDARIVSLAAAGWSFHALDDQGSIYVWGQLDGESFAMNNDGFSEPAKAAKTPHKLYITIPHSAGDINDGVKFTAISCGRSHSAALDSNHNVWVFTRWGRPCLLTSDLINPKFSSISSSSSPDVKKSSKVVQVESGWTNVAMLTASGDVYVIGEGDEFVDQLEAKLEELDALSDDDSSQARPDDDKVVPCTTMEISAAPLLLPEIPQDLPELTPEGDDRVDTQIVRIAAGDEFLIGLTNKGHVLSINLRSPTGVPWLKNEFIQKRIGWVYRPEYSEIDRIKQDPVWATAEGETNKPVAPKGPLHISHISAHFNTFVAYSITPPIVLMGTKSLSPENGSLTFTCNIMPSFHTRPSNDPVISVVLGDYHFAALTAQGHLLSWGSHSSGALGLGDPRVLEVGAPGGFARIEEKEMAIGGRFNEPGRVEVPSEVRFDWGVNSHGKKGKKKFCYAVTAGGWHTGALAIDLDYDDEDLESGDVSNSGLGEVETEADLFERWNTDQVPYPQPQIINPSPRLPGAFPHEEGGEGGASAYESPPFNPSGARNNRAGPPYPLPTGPFGPTPVHPIIRPGGGMRIGNSNVGDHIPGEFPRDGDDEGLEATPPFVNPVSRPLPGGQLGRGHLPFRVGFAGRGYGRGRGGGDGTSTSTSTDEGPESSGFHGNPPADPSRE
ncbi:hypothetical protein FRB94_000993 [Tulasnella sp. JGI-2019a]|nr:hypothetical protein FRB94_000993 [Tulasnella sp. JGI-2019a]